MKMKLFTASVLVAAFATPAFADFWIVQDASTKKCQIVEQRPTTTSTVIVGGDKVYKSRAEAETGMKTVKVCETR